ncbi:MAG: pyrophosphate--fructose-6-phosphate 1-phosphotransferase [Planctomycetota bacterium]|nr:MAG: pyrophosphate--fructose-6-phosphate 1-phosphotransferase [Planctomycetota bacterium]
MKKQKVALLTAGGLAPCLSAAVGGLIERYTEIAPGIKIIGYLDGYQGLLQGRSIPVTDIVREDAANFYLHGGSPLGNSRVKLTNEKDCFKRGLIKKGQNPLEVAAEQLLSDNITILHTIGGDDTNLTAAELAAYLKKNGYDLTVVGLPKTIDNDIYPIRQSLGAITAAEQGAIYFENVVNEQSANPRMLIIHEVMGRNCGWLTAATANIYRKRLQHRHFVPSFNIEKKLFDVDAIYIPEIPIDIRGEAARLKKVMNEKNSVNIFVAEGAGVQDIIQELENQGQKVKKDAFGHVKLDSINPGKWFANQFAKLVNAEKTIVEKSGYFARAAAANVDDLRLIKSCTDSAVDCGMRKESGVIGHDEDRNNQLRSIEFERIRGEKPLDTNQLWVKELFHDIGQPVNINRN